MYSRCSFHEIPVPSTPRSKSRRGLSDFGKLVEYVEGGVGVVWRFTRGDREFWMVEGRSVIGPFCCRGSVKWL